MKLSMADRRELDALIDNDARIERDICESQARLDAANVALQGQSSNNARLARHATLVAAGASFEDAAADGEIEAATRDVKALSDRIRVLREASRQSKARVADIQRKWSAATCGALEADYVAIVRKNVNAIVAAARASAAERDFVARLEHEGVAVGYLRSVPFLAIGRLADPNSKLRWWLKETVDRGIISRSELEKLLADDRYQVK